MAIYKRGKIYWYKFVWNGELIRESTKQGNDKVARQAEASHRHRLAKEKDERDAAAKRLGFDSSAVLRCPECDDWFPSNRATAGADRQKYCSPACARSREKKNTRIPTLAEFLSSRIEPWAKTRSSWQWYRSGIRPLVQCKSLADMPLDCITSEAVAGYAAHRQSHELQAGTINRELRVLRRVLRLGVEWGLLERSPKVQMLRGEKRRERVIGDDEFARYLTCAPALLADVATVLNDTGLRPDECHRLDWSDIAFTDGRHGKLLVRHGKTAAARRSLPLTPRLRAILESRWENAGRPEEGWVWPAQTKSGHIDHSTLRKQHSRTLRLSGVRAFVLYSLRHSFATRIAPHVDAWSLCKIMGWSSLSVAMTYIHPSEDRVLDAFTSLGGHNSGHTDSRKELPADGALGKSLKNNEEVVSAAGFEPATHALKDS
jgi:integrase